MENETQIENIHVLLPKLTIQELTDGIRAYHDMHKSSKWGETTNTILDRIITDYMEPLEGHRGFSPCSHAHTILTNEFIKRYINIIDSNTYDHDDMNGDEILKQLGLNNNFKK